MAWLGLVAGPCSLIQYQHLTHLGVPVDADVLDAEQVLLANLSPEELRPWAKSEVSNMKE